jgi:RimJ/RimL family protein N-acetyltransferase
MSSPAAISATTPSVAPKARPEVRVRKPRYSDIRTLVRIYRGQDEESRRLYHTFPNDRLRLTILFTYMVVVRNRMGLLLRFWPRAAVSLLVVTVGGSERPVAYGNTAFRRNPEGVMRAIFGYLVEAPYRGLGIGTTLHEEMIDEAVSLGVRRGGGMVVSTNVANLKVLAKLGFTLRDSDVVDRNAPEARNIETDGDLEEISRQRHALRAARSGSAA